MTGAVDVLDASHAKSIPTEEMEQLADLVRSHPEYLSTDWMIEAYASLGLEVLADPFNDSVTRQIVEALQTGRPFSVIRLGDGEMTFLALGADPATPTLDRHAFNATIANRKDSFAPDELWTLVLREMMVSAVLQADIVGVLGLWRPSKQVQSGDSLNVPKYSLRGRYGHWRGLDHMLQWARSGKLHGKVLASAHLYFGVLTYLDAIFAHAERIILITSHVTVVEELRTKYPARRVDHIAVGRPKVSDERSAAPQFLLATAEQLPSDLRGCCCLVGAGPWAEFYCTWIKQRAGVAVDIGSGFDLLAGEISRPIHRKLGLAEANQYAL